MSVFDRCGDADRIPFVLTPRVRNAALEVARSSMTPGRLGTRRCQSKRTGTRGRWPPPVRCSTFCTERSVTRAPEWRLKETRGSRGKRRRSIRPKRAFGTTQLTCRGGGLPRANGPFCRESLPYARWLGPGPVPGGEGGDGLGQPAPVDRGRPAPGSAAVPPGEAVGFEEVARATPRRAPPPGCLAKGRRPSGPGRSHRERAGQSVSAGIRPCHPDAPLNSKILNTQQKNFPVLPVPLGNAILFSEHDDGREIRTRPPARSRRNPRWFFRSVSGVLYVSGFR
jgi:hypothetical protein